jgi:hypothetical protein
MIEPPPSHEKSQDLTPDSQTSRETILRELDTILTSRFFRSAVRCKQFLTYVVQHKLDGHPELLKERTIGMEVFRRPAGYATGDDPVVRVQAGEVRRRLEQYYQAPEIHPAVRIELPVGCYSPAFQWTSAQVPIEPPLQLPIMRSEAPAARRKYKGQLVAACCFLIVVAAGLTFWMLHRPPGQKTLLEQFWSPVFLTRQPVLICLAKPVAYRPTEGIYRRYSRNHPGTFQTEADRSNLPLPLDPNEKLSWSDLFIYTDYGVAAGDVYAATAMSTLLGKFDKPSQLRIGTNYTYEDLRNSPAVIIGGFNNKWTMQLISSQHFALIEENEKYMIREQIPGGRVWQTRLGPHGETTEDFGIVSRLVDSKTGQFTIAVAGIGPKGTQAVGEFASTGQYIDEGLRNAPANWQKGNLEIVLQTNVTDSVAGPPHVVAAYYW